jgi:hypothetical protein
MRANPRTPFRVIGWSDRYWPDFDFEPFGQLLHRSGAWRDRWTEAVFVVFDWGWRTHDDLVAVALRTI